MAKRSSNHPWHESHAYVDPELYDLKAVAQFLHSAPKIDNGYSTQLAIYQFADKHGRNGEEMEQRIEMLIAQGFAEISEGRLYRLTPKGRKLIQ